MKNFFLSFIFIVFTCSLFPLENEEKKSLIQDLMDQNIQSTPWDDGEWWDEDDFATFLKKYLKSFQNPHPRFKRSSAFRLLKQENWELPGCSIDDTVLWKDLDLFVGRGKKSVYVADCLDRTQTELGKTALFALLAHPTADAQIVLGRQALIKTLVDQADLFSSVEKSLSDSALAEAVLLGFFNQNVIKNASRFCYFQGMLAPGNSSSITLQARAIFEHCMRSYGTLMAGIATGILSTYGISQLTSIEHDWLDQKAQEYKNDAGYTVRFLWPIFTNRLLRGFLALSSAALCAQACYEGAKWEHACSVLELALQTLAITIGQSMNALLSLAKSIEGYPELAGHQDLKPLFALKEQALDSASEMSELFELFSSDTLKGEASFFSLQGRTLRAVKLFDELKEKFFAAIIAGAKLDAYMSCARLVKESTDKRVQFCFAQFCQADHPCIQAQSLWHPLINQEHVVAHDYTLGVDGAARMMIITGPNEGGKSTILKEVALALVMAQSIGVVPAKSFVVTPFKTIATYLTIVDDTGSGDSLFRASAIRAGQLLETIEKARSGEFVFAAFDELFSGTSPQEGEAAAYSVVKGIGQSPYVISIVSTHFPRLNSLAHESANFAHYRVSIKVNPDGRIEYPYTLEQGVSDQHVALHVLKSQGISHRFLDEAIDQLAF